MNSWKDLCGRKRSHSKKKKFSFYPNHNMPNYPIDHQVPEGMSEGLAESIRTLLED